jgi:hypothetical protein
MVQRKNGPVCGVFVSDKEAQSHILMFHENSQPLYTIVTVVVGQTYCTQGNRTISKV